MALLTRSRRSDDPAAEALDRAREVSEQVAERARDVRDAAEPRIAQAREAAEPRIARAREAAEPVVERAREASAPAFAQARRALGTVLRLLVRVAALVPGLGASVLGTVSRLLGRLADRSAELADVEPPSRAGARRRAVLWFVGGFATGAAAGYAVSEMNRDDHDHAHHDDPWQSGAPTTDATPARG